MRRKEANSGLDRVRFQLRADGVPKETPNPLRSGIHSRGYLPHVKREGASYFVTCRLADSLPQSVLMRLKAEKEARLKELQHSKEASHAKSRSPHENPSVDQIEKDYQQQIDDYLDRGYGACWLGQPAIANLAAEALHFFHEKHYLLDDWVVMPNHLHLILWPMPNFTLSDILKSRKQFIAAQANRLLNRTGQSFWQPESHDHWIRDDTEKAQIRHYIRDNPRKAGLCGAPENWQWSSAWRDES